MLNGILLVHTREAYRQPAHSKGTHTTAARIDTAYKTMNRVVTTISLAT